MRLVHASGDATRVAIGAPEAAAAHGLVVLRRGIANHAENFTRFVVLARHPVPVELSAPCKTSLILIARHEHGALMRSLGVLAASGHSMTKLESRPRPGRPLEYMFFVDFEGNVADPRTAAALDDLRSTALHLKVLGSYPAKTTARGRPAGRRHPAGADGRTRRRARKRGAASSGAEDVEELPARGAWRALGRHRDSGRQPPDRRAPASSSWQVRAPSSWRTRSTPPRESVREAGAQVLRGGVFKPRTSPYAFQGLGWEGLELLVAAGRSHGDADHQRGHGRRPGEAHGRDGRCPPGRDAEHAELRPAARAGQGRPAGAAQARPVEHHRRVARCRRVHPRASAISR